MPSLTSDPPAVTRLVTAETTSKPPTGNLYGATPVDGHEVTLNAKAVDPGVETPKTHHAAGYRSQTPSVTMLEDLTPTGPYSDIDTSDDEEANHEGCQVCDDDDDNSVSIYWNLLKKTQNGQLTVTIPEATGKDGRPDPTHGTRTSPLGAAMLRSLNCSDPDKWAEWLRHFHEVRTNRQWSEPRAILEMRAAMDGTAALLVLDVIVDGRDTLQDVIAYYDNRFVPANRHKTTQELFKKALQTEGESLTEYHGRLKCLFVQARAETLEDAGIDKSAELIEKFIFSLFNPGIRVHMARRAPSSYRAALHMAKTLTEAVIQAMDEADGMETRRPPPTTPTFIRPAVPYTGPPCAVCGAATHPTTNANANCYIVTLKRELARMENHASYSHKRLCESYREAQFSRYEPCRQWRRDPNENTANPAGKPGGNTEPKK